MSPNKQNQAALACWAMVANMFAMFHNPRMRGAKFTWEEFPTMMEEHCTVHIFMYLPIPKKQIEEFRTFAAATGKEIATTLVNKMTKEV